jgi:hypothetical protein
MIGKDIAIPDAGHLKLPSLGAARIVRRRESPAGWNLKSVTASRNRKGIATPPSCPGSRNLPSLRFRRIR